MTIILDTSRTNCFVSPSLCKHLEDAGLSTHVQFHWKVYHGIAKLVTNAFDTDNYYAEGERLADYASPPNFVLPAYSIKDVERLLPVGYLLTCNETGKYEASLSDLYLCNSSVADRMPDAFALLLLEGLRKKVIDLKKLNAILEK